MEIIKSFIISLFSIFSTFGPPSSSRPPTAPPPTKILESGLPDYHLIQATFVPQAPEKNWDQPWQDACEEAALLTLDFYHRQATPSAQHQKEAILAMVEFETRQGWTHDVNLEQMAQIGREYLGLKPEIYSNPSIEQIKSLVANDIPIIVPANGKVLFRENRHFKNGGPWYHNLVILGFDDRSGKFIVHDVGTQFGAYFEYSYQLLFQSIHDFPVSGRKEDIAQGPR